jgi:glycerol-3-phosphate dehydrogenase
MTTQAPAPLSVRATALRALADETFDVLVVGGGIVGAGALLDATSRGLRAALVEQGDIAIGTSGRSSRLIHGGLRYLEQLHFGLVAEALAERSRLLNVIAPHLVRLEPFLFPVYGIPVVHQAFYGAGILLYDILGSRRDGGFGRHLTVNGALRYAPQLKRKGLTGAIVYHDGVEDDARLTLAVVRTALARGALAATRVRAEAPILESGRVVGARVRDVLSGDSFDVRASHVIDATGVWAGRPDERFAAIEDTAPIAPSRGSHVIVRRERLDLAGGITLRIPGRVVFIIPWPGHWIIGTTDHLDPRDPDRLTAPIEDVHELLDTVNRTMDAGLTEADIVGTYAGMRPLLEGAGGDTVKASREHRVTSDRSGLVRIGGGKYTTYRVMAHDVVDAALGRDAARARPSRTADLPLVGAAPKPQLDALAAELARSGEVDPATAARLVMRHGVEARAVLALRTETGLLRPLAPGLDHLEAEVAWAARRELALTVDDVLARRMRLAQELPDRGASIAHRVAEILGSELGWDLARRTHEVDSYLATARREYGVPGRSGADAAPPPSSSAPAAPVPAPPSA